MRRVKEEADLTRQKLLETALFVFSKQGYSAARLEDIAEEAGVTRGAIYHHFGSKLELYVALVEDLAAVSENIFGGAQNFSQSPLSVLRHMLLNSFKALTSNQKYRAILELTIFKTGTAPELDEMMRKKADNTLKTIEFLADLIKKAIDQGEIRAEVNPKDAAASLMAFQYSLGTLWLLNPNSIDLAERSEVIVDLYLKSLTP